MADANNSSKSFNLVYTGFVAMIFLLIAGILFFRSGAGGYNDKFIWVYTLGALVGAIASIIFGGFGVFNWIKTKATGEELPFQAGHISESSKYLILSKPIWLKFIVIIAWTILVTFVSLSGLKIWDEPDVYADVQEFAVGTEAMAVEKFGIANSIFDIGIIPGFTEDISALIIASFIIAILHLIRMVIKLITKSNLFNMNLFWNSLFILISCPIASFIFMKAHNVVAGSNIQFLFSAWLFQTFNLLVMFYTGFFLPLAHIIHNSIFAFGFAVAFSIAFMIIPIIKTNKTLGGVKNAI